LEIRVQSRDIEKALRSLKKKLDLDGVFGELKKRRFYEKPSVKKKRKRLEAQKRKRKLLKRSRPTNSTPRPGSGTVVNRLHPTTQPETAGMK
jgi:small subunit ribosomal protein S21